MKKISILFIIVFFNLQVFSQNDTIPEGLIKYTGSFKFTDGIFLNFSQVKGNRPIPKSKIVTDIDYEAYDFFEKILDMEKINLYDRLGNMLEVDIDKIWGFSDKGILYINYNREYNRIPMLGKLCHFIANKTFTQYNSYDYYRYNSYYNTPTTNTEMRQYILDFETGKIYSYELRSVEALLMKDPELYDEFNRLRRGRKKKMIFLYIRKYNTKHPLYLPKNE